MTHPPTSRGAAPGDDALFGPGALPRLRVAQEEVAWLLGRGYPVPTVIRTVGDHHQLHARQRLALQRSTCGAAQGAARAARSVPVAQLAGQGLAIDGLNLLVTLEVALSGGPVLAGADGALRDLAGLRGNYHLIEATEVALGLLGDAARELGLASLSFWLDAPVSSSGRLRARILERAPGFPCAVTADLVPDADAALAGRERVVSSDAAVIDACPSWVNLAAWIVAERIPAAWIVALGGAPGSPPDAARGQPSLTA
jgi:hypothetical protein